MHIYHNSFLHYNVVLFFKFVKTSEIGIRQTFGKEGGILTSDTLCNPGFRAFIPLIQSIDIVSTRISQDTYCFETKTVDNVFTTLNINVQYQIKKEDARNAYFVLDNINQQLKTYVENTVRSLVSSMTLDDTYKSQHEVSEKVFEVLKDKMLSYGVTIIDTLVTEIVPARQVKEAMNNINASEREKIAAKNKADAEYIHRTRLAEAHAEQKRLNGVGMSNMRKEIVDGYINSISEGSSILNLTPSDMLKFVTRIQELDVNETIGTNTNTKVLFVPTRNQQSEEFHHIVEQQSLK